MLVLMLPTSSRCKMADVCLQAPLQWCWTQRNYLWPHERGVCGTGGDGIGHVSLSDNANCGWRLRIKCVTQLFKILLPERCPTARFCSQLPPRAFATFPSTETTAFPVFTRLCALSFPAPQAIPHIRKRKNNILPQL
mmetsp:Transcript_110502/g.219712  ORF Transcript_110502/g.219712 Transcript_110502/m.219712 type:complete len:137 (+) Transcript_110502:53-463(+)